MTKIASVLKNTEIICGVLSFILLAILGHFSSSTYDTGDSVTHFLYSKYSWQVHYFFVHAWAKPVFVLISSPFAQFGFAGMKLFQAMVLASSVFFTVKIAREIGYSAPWFAGAILMSMPQIVLMTSSGLTEPLCALFVIAGVYFLFKQEVVIAMIIFSFLYYVRSEGMIVDIVVVLYLLIKKRAKYIPLLGVSILFYGIVGSIFNANFFWYILNNPYNHPQGFYGYGNLIHYFDVLKGLSGDPIYFLIFSGGMGMIYWLYRFLRFRPQTVPHFNERFFLIYGIAVAYFVFESVIWWKGLFGSFGMPRVLVGVMPLFALIAFEGWHAITGFFNFYNKALARIVMIAITGYVVAFPFLNTPRSYHFPEDFIPNEEGQVVTQAVQWLQNESGLKGDIYFSDPFAAIALKNVEVFDKDMGDFKIFKDPRQLPSGDIYIWDSWYSVTERKAKLEDLTVENLFTLIRCFESHSSNPWKVCILRKN